MTETNTPWPYIKLETPPGADDEETGRVTQAAVDAGALGGLIEKGVLALYMDRHMDEVAAAAIRRAVEDEAASLGWPPLQWRLELLPDAPWATAWKIDFVPLPIGHSLLIRPDWELNDPPLPGMEDRKTVWLRPGLGFGTGRHETTRLAMETLERHLKPGMRVLDFGSGSGVLSITARLLGAASILGVDCDSDAILNALENLDINDLDDDIYFIHADRADGLHGPFDLVVCNMLPQNALAHLPHLAKLLASPNSLLIYSGFLTDQKSEILAALNASGLRTLEFDNLNEWGLWVTAPGKGL